MWVVQRQCKATETIMGLIVFSLVPAVITIPVTAMLCRVRMARKRRVAYGTMFLAVFIVILFWLVLASGGNCFSLKFWSALNSPVWTRSGANIILLLKSIAFGAAISLLPAFGVVHYYQKKSERDKPPAT